MSFKVTAGDEGSFILENYIKGTLMQIWKSPYVLEFI